MFSAAVNQSSFTVRRWSWYDANVCHVMSPQQPKTKTKILIKVGKKQFVHTDLNAKNLQKKYG